MGMTDRQFDVHLTSLLRHLEDIKKELESKDVKSEKLDIMLKDLKEQLSRP